VGNHCSSSFQSGEAGWELETKHGSSVISETSEPAVADRRGIGFGWLQNAWLLHARLKILTTENPRAGSLRRVPPRVLLGGDTS
jgi:hypothetical protein